MSWPAGAQIDPSELQRKFFEGHSFDFGGGAHQSFLSPPPDPFPADGRGRDLFPFLRCLRRQVLPMVLLSRFMPREDIDLCFRISTLPTPSSGL